MYVGHGGGFVIIVGGGVLYSVSYLKLYVVVGPATSSRCVLGGKLVNRSDRIVVDSVFNVKRAGLA